MSIPIFDPSIRVSDLQAAANKWLEAGYAYWELCAKMGRSGAVVWIQNTEGHLCLFTRGEYDYKIKEAVAEGPRWSMSFSVDESAA